MKKLSLLMSLGMIATLVTQAASASDACSGLSGTYTLRTKGAHFIAWLETYTTKITISPDQSKVTVASNWGLDYQIRLNSTTHTVAEAGNEQNFGGNLAGEAYSYIANLNHIDYLLTGLQMSRVVGDKSDAKAADALECAIEKVGAELAVAQAQKIAYDQAANLRIQKVSSDVNENKSVTLSVARAPAQPQPAGAGQTKAQ